MAKSSIELTLSIHRMDQGDVIQEVIRERNEKSVTALFKVGYYEELSSHNFVIIVIIIMNNLN